MRPPHNANPRAKVLGAGTLDAIRSQVEVAEMLGCSYQHVAKVEDRALAKIAAALRADPEVERRWKEGAE